MEACKLIVVREYFVFKYIHKLSRVVCLHSDTFVLVVAFLYNFLIFLSYLQYTFSQEPRHKSIDLLVPYIYAGGRHVVPGGTYYKLVYVT